MKNAGAAQLNDIEIYVDVTSIGTDTTYVPVTASYLTLDLGHDDSSNQQLFGHILDMAWYNTRLDST